MTVRKQKKVRKLRGSRTHSWGHPKKHRGSGSRGGVGKAGVGKKGSHKKTYYYNLGEGFVGYKKGFTNPTKNNSVMAINLETIENNIPRYIEQKIATESKGIVELDLNQTGYNKVLGSGTIRAKLKIKAKSFSAKAIEKIKAAGGEAITE
jgi:large subunit ribosomal protein L15